MQTFDNGEQKVLEKIGEGCNAVYLNFLPLKKDMNSSKSLAERPSSDSTVIFPTPNSSDNSSLNSFDNSLSNSNNVSYLKTKSLARTIGARTSGGFSPTIDPSGYSNNSINYRSDYNADSFIYGKSNDSANSFVLSLTTAMVLVALIVIIVICIINLVY